MPNQDPTLLVLARREHWQVAEEASLCTQGLCNQANETGAGAEFQDASTTQKRGFLKR